MLGGGSSSSSVPLFSSSLQRERLSKSSFALCWNSSSLCVVKHLETKMIQYILGYFAQNRAKTYTLMFKWITMFGPILYSLCFWLGLKSHDSRPLSCLLPDDEPMFNMENLGSIAYGSSEWRFGSQYLHNRTTKRFDFDDKAYDFSHLK